MLNLVYYSVDMDHVGGNDLSDVSNISGGNVISFEDMDEMSVDVAGLDVLGSSNVVVDGSDDLVQLLAGDLASDEPVVSLLDNGVSEHASDVLEDVSMRPLVDFLA